MSYWRRLEQSTSSTSDYDLSKVQFGEKIRLDELTSDVAAKEWNRQQLLDDCDYALLLGGEKGACELLKGTEGDELVKSVYLGCLSSEKAERKTTGSFGLYHKQTKGMINLFVTLSLHLIYRSLRGKFVHHPIEQQEFDGSLFYCLGRVANAPRFVSLENLVRYYRTYVLCIATQAK